MQVFLGSVAQLNRASDSGSAGHGFESHPSHDIIQKAQRNINHFAALCFYPEGMGFEWVLRLPYLLLVNVALPLPVLDVFMLHALPFILILPEPVVVPWKLSVKTSPVTLPEPAIETFVFLFEPL